MPPPRLSIEAVEKTYRARTPVHALRALSLEAAAGECVTVLGSSGSGKTTLLRIVAGLTRPDAGRICFDGRDVRDVPPERRSVGFVFQNDALFAHATAYENVAFGLRARRERDVDARVRAVAERVRVSGYLERRPAALSGGERQRVALARALATNPSVLLLDEPLSRLDAPLRAELRRELQVLVRERSATTLYVTHDQAEALTVGDRVALMHDGALEAVGDPHALFERPPTAYVAQALGNPAMSLVFAADIARKPSLPQGARVGWRPDAITIAANEDLRGTVVAVEDFVDVAYARVDGPFGSLTVRLRDERPSVGETVGLRVDWRRAHAFGADGRRIETAAPAHADA